MLRDHFFKVKLKKVIKITEIRVYSLKLRVCNIKGEASNDYVNSGNRFYPGMHLRELNE